MIFGAIAIAWLAYLVPHFVRRREDEQIDEPELDNRFADSMRIVRTGAAPLLNQDLEQIQTFEVSTPQTRRAAVADLRRLERLAASRRRRVLLGLMAVLSATLGVCAVALIPWWAAAIPGGLLLIFVVVARVSVRMMRKGLDVRYHVIRRGGDEQTVFLSRQGGVDRWRERGCEDRKARRVEAGCALGSGADHDADVRLQTSRSEDRTDDRPVRPWCGLVIECRATRDRRRAAGL